MTGYSEAYPSGILLQNAFSFPQVLFIAICVICVGLSIYLLILFIKLSRLGIHYLELSIKDKQRNKM